MIHEVDLVSYLPPFLTEYNEINETLKAENPEFTLVWEAANRILYNEFIATADEYGISRFENLLGIYPSSEDTLESRRSRVQVRWFNSIPYTWRVFLKHLIALCGERNFTVTTDFLYYHIDLAVNLELYGQVEELERMVETMVPCNMVFSATNKIPCEAEGVALIAGGVCAAETFFITNDGVTHHKINGANNVVSGVVITEFIEANNLEE